VAELAELAAKHSSAAADAHAAAAAEAAAQQLLASLQAADKEAAEKLQDQLKLVDDVTRRLQEVRRGYVHRLGCCAVSVLVRERVVLTLV
jgi:hypothetical protein